PPAAAAGRRALLRWTGMTVALVLLLVAAARPGVPIAQADAPTSSRGGANIFFVVDRSEDSAVDDFGGRPRMAGIRDDIDALIDAHPGARFAVISFASRPAVDWPLSSDAWSLRPVVEALNPYPGAAADQVNAAAAATVLRYQMISAGQQYPGADNLVYYFGSGAPQSTVPQGEFDVDAVDGGDVFGYAADGAGDQRLREIADQLGVPFVDRRPGEAVPTGTQAAASAPVANPAGERRDEFYWLLTVVASALLLVEIALSVRDLRRARSTAREVRT
ncbi:vWA domain-containing protein, partial [Mycolicibacterium psychrotolerans]|uniref:VWA domain-containing protein n=1 Tax=Mycolicibacterium psychrotolerans TaxID=216929 RepID=UPI0021F28881